MLINSALNIEEPNKVAFLEISIKEILTKLIKESPLIWYKIDMFYLVNLVKQSFVGLSGKFSPITRDSNRKQVLVPNFWLNVIIYYRARLCYK